jgi:hypothetical protein
MMDTEMDGAGFYISHCTDHYRLNSAEIIQEVKRHGYNTYNALL